MNEFFNPFVYYFTTNKQTKGTQFLCKLSFLSSLPPSKQVMSHAASRAAADVQFLSPPLAR